MIPSALCVGGKGGVQQLGVTHYHSVEEIFVMKSESMVYHTMDVS